jgi:hypothetical protein
VKFSGSTWLAAALGVIGLALLVVAAINSDYTACAPGEPVGGGVNADGSTYVSCGGTDPTPFLVLGLVALGLALAAAALSVRRGRLA